MKKNGPWTVKSERLVFENPWIAIEDHAVVHPDGAAGEYGVVRFKNLAIGVLPVDADGNVFLVGQHRYPLDRYSWELPEGGGGLDVPAIESARRELEEETGVVAREWRELATFDISNSVTDERAICYLAWDLTPGNAAPDGSEALTMKKVKFEELLEMVMNGSISDSLTIIMTLKAHLLALRRDAPEPICRHLAAGRA
jgi:8-oxo-dGTP pyrophosphatase MutT (NUDIX family)